MKLLLLLPLSLLADSVDHLRGEEVLDLSKMSIVTPQPKVPGSQVEGLPPGSTRMTFKPPQLSDEEVTAIMYIAVLLTQNEDTDNNVKM